MKIYESEDALKIVLLRLHIFLIEVVETKVFFTEAMENKSGKGE